MLSVSVVIPVRNRWSELGQCLSALANQQCAPEWELILVDDGSEVPAPDRLKQTLSAFVVRTRLIHQASLGIAAARNRGASLAAGELVLFLDSDSAPGERCLSLLAASAKDNPSDDAFQLRITSKTDIWIGRMDFLFFSSAQAALLTKDGHILYADTSGFAIRREYLEQSPAPFDIAAGRGEDTLLLTELFSKDRQPRFVPNAIVYHNHAGFLVRYLWKHLTIGYRAARADRRVKTLVAQEWQSPSRRKNIFRELFTNSRRYPWGFRALALVLIAYSLKLTGRALYALFGLKPGRYSVLNSHVDAVSSTEIVARLVQAAELHTGFTATYLNNWSLVKAERDRAFRKALDEFEVCFADGIGVVYTLLLTRLSRIKKVTANDFYIPLFQELANRRLKVALVGAKEGVARMVARHAQCHFPGLQIVLCSTGYLDSAQESAVATDLVKTRPDLVIVGRSQPTQELWVQRCKTAMPKTVFLCVGGLLDYICGNVRATPLWIRRTGFEWLYRVIYHPERYWFMYVWGIPLQLWYISKYQCTRILRWVLRVRPSHVRVFPD